MEAVIAFLVGAASLAWWRRARSKPPAFTDRLADDAKVVLHVAEHAQRSRDHATFTATHVLYGLLQDEVIVQAIRDVGGDPEAIEDAVLGALDAPADHQTAITTDAYALLARAVAGAQQHRRLVTATDLWAYLLRGDGRAHLDACKLDGLAVLHVLVHAARLPALADASGDVLVVIRNDDYTTQDFVTTLLVRELGLPESEATAQMLSTHAGGKAILARLPAGVARAHILRARELARAEQFPLWIDAEPV
jgi:ATP-dependent Clp protease adaptor protein ClpS